ncbi:MAG: hypothetical protein H6672_09040 [Anaerolineaceae bacterium]|nr:hypothetical protein [Anaerolineaceae bacterium]
MNDQLITREERLRALLAEDVESTESAEALLPLVTHLEMWSAPSPSAAATASLIETLLPELPPQESRRERVLSWWPLLLLRAQLRVVRGEIWWSTALVMLLGVVVTLATYDPASPGLLPFTVLSPIMAAVGVALLYDSDIQLVLELESTTPVSTRLLLLARLTLVFGFNLFLGSVGSVALALFQSDLSLWPLILSWLAPMTFLSCFAFFLSVLTEDTFVGMVAGLFVWGLHVVMQNFPFQDVVSLVLSLPGLTAAEGRPLLFVAALFLLVVALWLAGMNDREIRRDIA